MLRKRNESEFGRMARRYGWYAYKWRDRGYVSCPRCHRPIRNCPYCHADMLLEKAEQKPDFLLALSYVYVEGKGATDRWNFAESITNIQRRVMLEAEGWLFLEIGIGRAPEGRAAYFVPWNEWLRVETALEDRGVHSLIWEKAPRSRTPTAEEVLGAWKLAWFKGDWTIPPEHEFWHRHKHSGLDEDYFGGDDD